MQKIVIDASTAAKWFFEEEMKEKADGLLDSIEERRFQPIVPELFFNEMTSICAKWVRRKKIKPSEGKQIFEDLIQLPFETLSDKELADVALDNSLMFEISVYDALYLSVAEIYHIPFITADLKLFKQCQKEFDFIQFLRDFKP